jgi:glycosyltransferase involved in cell wall biosynthesis
VSTVPFLSVCIPTYNREQYLQKCLRSVIPQITDDVEVIVQDNASTDSTWSFLSTIAHPRVHVARNSSNIGLVGNFIEVVRRARGTYIYVLTDDDYLLIDGLKDTIDFARSSHCKAFKTAFFLFNEVSKTGQHVSVFPENISGSAINEETAARIYHESNIFTGFVFRKDLFNENAVRDNINNWYPSLLLFGMAGLNVGYLAEPTNIHIWENETHWGISPEKRTELNRGQVETLLYLLKRGNVTMDYYLELVKRHYEKWIDEDNHRLLEPLDKSRREAFEKFLSGVRRRILMRKSKAWLKSRFFG